MLDRDEPGQVAQIRVKVGVTHCEIGRRDGFGGNLARSLDNPGNHAALVFLKKPLDFAEVTTGRRRIYGSPRRHAIGVVNGGPGLQHVNPQFLDRFGNLLGAQVKGFHVHDVFVGVLDDIGDIHGIAVLFEGRGDIRVGEFLACGRDAFCQRGGCAGQRIVTPPHRGLGFVLLLRVEITESFGYHQTLTPLKQFPPCQTVGPGRNVIVGRGVGSHSPISF